MSIPKLSYAQKNCISIADNLLSIIARVGFMSSSEINDVIAMMEDAKTKNGTDLEDEAHEFLIDMLRALRAQAVDYERARIISPKNALP